MQAKRDLQAQRISVEDYERELRIAQSFFATNQKTNETIVDQSSSKSGSRIIGSEYDSNHAPKQSEWITNF